MQNHLLLWRRQNSVPFDLYRTFRWLGLWTSSIHDKRGGKLTETISFYLLAITVVKYGRHEPHINQFSLDECALREAFCQGCLTSAASLCTTLALSLPALLNYFSLNLNNPQSEDVNTDLELSWRKGLRGHTRCVISVRILSPWKHQEKISLKWMVSVN